MRLTSNLSLILTTSDSILLRILALDLPILGPLLHRQRMNQTLDTVLELHLIGRDLAVLRAIPLRLWQSSRSTAALDGQEIRRECELAHFSVHRAQILQRW